VDLYTNIEEVGACIQMIYWEIKSIPLAETNGNMNIKDTIKKE